MAQISKYKEGGGLGISLEGTVEKIDGAEQNPHHYIRYRRSRTRTVKSGIHGAEPALLHDYVIDLWKKRILIGLVILLFVLILLFS